MLVFYSLQIFNDEQYGWFASVGTSVRGAD